MMKNKKPVQMALTLFIALGIVMTGAFAWSSFSQSRVNLFNELQLPDVNLHDDFAGGPNKDVYVENSGVAAAVVRVRLTEFLQTENRGSMVRGHLRDDDKAEYWAPHNALVHDAADGSAAIDDCRLIPPDVTDTPWVVDGVPETFHDYYRWTMANAEKPTGQIYFRPATADQKGDYDLNGIMLREPQVVSDPLTETAEQGDAHLDYKAQVDALMAAGDKTEAEALLELGLGKTLPSGIMTMTEWVSGSGNVGDAGYRAPYAMGNYWVIDESDGWCYWASPLAGGTATGLLLDKVERTQKKFDSNAEYCINVRLQAVDKTDLGQFEVVDNGGISANGKRLAELVAGKLIIAADGVVYADNGDGTYTVTENADGPVTEAKPFVGLGVTEDGSPLGYAAPAESRIEIGQRVTITELNWGGSDYTNYDELSREKNNNWYNLKSTDETGVLTAEGKQIYEVQGITLGIDNCYYLTLAPMVESSNGGVEPLMDEMLYIGSVIKTTDTQPVLLASAETEETAETTGVAYKQANPGAGPFGVIYPGDDGIPGNDDDGRVLQHVTIVNRRFYHIGNGVYLEVNNKGETVSKDDPVKYFFAGRLVNNTIISSATGEVDERVNTVFPLQLSAGDRFNITLGAAVRRSIYAPVVGYSQAADGLYTFGEVTADANGTLSMTLTGSKPGVVICGDDNILGNAGDEFSTESVDFTEPLLLSQGILFSEQLAEGKTFTSDGYEWVVLNADDGYGNRLIMTTTRVASMGGAVEDGVQNVPQYRETLWPAKADTFAKGLTQLLPYTRCAAVPDEDVYAGTNSWDSVTEPFVGLSQCVSGEVGYKAFPISAGEYKKYILGNPALADYKLAKDENGNAVSSFLRSRMIYSSSNMSFGVSVPNGPGNPMAGISSDAQPRMAMWVRFSDAPADDATPAAEITEIFLLEQGIAFSDQLTVGKEFKVDGLDWLVLNTDEYGNRFILSKQTVSSMSARMSANVDTPAYHNTLWPARATAFMDTLTVLKTCATGAVLPLEPEYANEIPWANIPAGDGLSVANNSGVPLTFPLSAGEYRDYVVNSGILTAEQKTEYNAGTWGLRSRYTVYATTVSNGNPWDAYADSKYPPRMAMWVRFGDAEKIATATAAQMEKWQSGIPMATLKAGDQFDLADLHWVVLDKDSSDNLLISTTKGAYSTKANNTSVVWSYSGSTLESSVLNFYNTNLSLLHQYTKNSTTNIESPGTTAGGYTLPAANAESGNTNGLAMWLVNVKSGSALSVVTTGTGSKAFVLSASDLNVLADKYSGGRTNFAVDYMVNGEAFWLRSRGNAVNATARAAGSGVYDPATATWANTAINDNYSINTWPVRPALWVKFN